MQSATVHSIAKSMYFFNTFSISSSLKIFSEIAWSSLNATHEPDNQQFGYFESMVFGFISQITFSGMISGTA
jgi:hypothetical protein